MESTTNAELAVETESQAATQQATADINNAATPAVQTQEPVTNRPLTNSNETRLQRSQAYDNEMQSRRQQYQAAMSGRRQEMAKAVEAQRAELQRMRQNQQETRKKVDVLQEQIFELREKIHQLLQERHARQRP